MATPGRPAITAHGLPSQLPDIDPEETADWLEHRAPQLDRNPSPRACPSS